MTEVITRAMIKNMSMCKLWAGEKRVENSPAD
jgi:hypothetical protein